MGEPYNNQPGDLFSTTTDARGIKPTGSGTTGLNFIPSKPKFSAPLDASAQKSGLKSLGDLFDGLIPTYQPPVQPEINLSSPTGEGNTISVDNAGGGGGGGFATGGSFGFKQESNGGGRQQTFGSSAIGNFSVANSYGFNQTSNGGGRQQSFGSTRTSFGVRQA